MFVRRRAPVGSKTVRLLLGTLALLVAGSMAPGNASAELYAVNEKGDGADAATDKVCDTVAGGGPQCSLRAAIEESNASTTEDDSIKFDGGFIGDPSDDKIVIGGTAPEITDKVKIFAEGNLPGQRCEPIAGILGPCVQIERATPTGDGLVVAADEVEIRSVAVVGSTTGIDVVNEALEFRLEDSWIGVLLNGGSGVNGTGVRLGPGTEGAIIGGPNEGQRDVFGNNGTGLDLEGSSFASIGGNYFGVGPGGGVDPGEETLANNLGNDLEISDYEGAAAESNNVGANLDPAFVDPPCDTSCNVFGSRNVSTGFVNIDLNGDGGPEEPASGPNFIQGNYIGLDADGTALGQAEIGKAGIFVGGADEVVIGGPEAGQQNRINGAEAGVQAGPSSQDLKIEGNRIGLDAAGTGSERTPSTEGIAVDVEGTAAGHAATIAGNRIAMAGGNAIELRGNGPTGTTIAQNLIGRGVGGETLTAGSVGITVTQGAGSTIEGNVVERAHLIGIVLEGSNNTVVGNEVIGTEEDSGIVVQAFGPQASSGNTIGGDTSGDENVISGSGSNAIDVVDGADTDNQILRNTGSANSGLFIDLGRDGLGNQPAGPNGGIQAPAITSATPTAAGGGAQPGATIRVFRKATPQNGEVEGFLGQATADGSGNWSLAYATPLPLGTEIGATQTGLEGTSELAQATTAAPPPPAGGGDGSGGKPKPTKKEKHRGKGKGKGKRRDKSPPQTTITKGPPGRSHKRTARFKFVSSEAGSTFQCRIDRKPFRTCRTPKRYRRLKPGKHVFKVRATDAAGNTDPTPAVRRFKVIR